MPFDPKLTPAGTAVPSARVLEPVDRLVEVLCGLIMVLTFTLATPLSDRSSVRSMLIGALGCNLAWGIVDAAAYLMVQLSERRSGIRALRALRAASEPAAAHRILTGAMPPVLAAVLLPDELDAIRRRLNQQPEPTGPHLSGRAWRGALGVFLLVFVSTLPVAIPFAVVSNVALARRISNFVALAMLFFVGYSFGRTVGFHPVLVALAMVAFGTALVFTTIILGG
jgi:hypothetical protein